jgi:hypothetical protein
MFDLPDFTAETSLQASVTGVKVQEHNGDLIVTTAGGQTLFSMSLGPLDSNVVRSVAAEVGQIKQGLTRTIYVAGLGNVAAHWTVNGLSISTTSHEITTSVAIKLPDEVEISTSGTVHTPAPYTSKPVPVELDVTTTLTFQPPVPETPGRQPVRVPVSKRVTEPSHAPAHTAVPVLTDGGRAAALNGRPTGPDVPGDVGRGLTVLGALVWLWTAAKAADAAGSYAAGAG